MSETKATVFLVDDDASHLASMVRLMRASGYRVESFSSAGDFLARLPSRAAGCVVTDLKMPGMDGMELQEALARSHSPLPIVFLTGHGDLPASVSAMRGGAEDFLAKTAPADKLLAAVERALERDARERGERARTAELLSRFDRLTPRERDVLARVLRGLLNKQIALELGISDRSVKRHRRSLMDKLEVDSVAELARLAVMSGLDVE